MGYYDFPHTRNYDTDLGYLIKKYFDLSKDYNTLVKIYEIIKKDIADITIKQLQEWLDDGTLASLLKNLVDVPKTFKTLSDLKSTLSIVKYSIASTLGYNSINDGGGATYFITDEAPDDYYETLNNGLFAYIIGEKTTAKMGKFENDDITELVEKYQPFTLSYDHVVNISEEKYYTYTIDNIKFNDHKISNISGVERATLKLQSSKDHFKLKDIRLYLHDCSNVKLSNFNLERSIIGGCMDVVNVNYLIIDNFNITSPATLQNTDGIHIAKGHDISISNGYLECGDDAIAIITDDYDGGSFGDVYNVTVTNVTMGENNHSGFSYNNQTHIINNILFENCVITSKSTCPIYGIITTPQQPFTGHNGTFKFNNCILKNNIVDDEGNSARRRIVIMPKAKDVTFDNCTMYLPTALTSNFALHFNDIDYLKITNCNVINNCEIGGTSPFVFRANNFNKSIIVDNVDIYSKSQNMKIAEFYNSTDNIIISNVHINKPTAGAIVETAQQFTCKSILFDNVIADENSYLITTNSVIPVGISNCKCSTNGLNVTSSYLRPLYGVITNNIPTQYKKGDEWTFIGDTVRKYIGTGDNVSVYVQFNQ